MSKLDGMFVVVWDMSGEEPTVTQVTRWDDWIRIPIEERSLNITMLRAKDELDAYARATRGERWDNWTDSWDSWTDKGANNA